MAGDAGHAVVPVRVVVADDSAEMRSLVRWALERGAGVLVAGEAATPEDAVRLAAELAPDAVLLDLQMPGMTPAALLESVAAAVPDVPIVTFSGYEPDLIAPEQAHLVRLHVPKTTDLALLRETIVGLARGTA